MQGSAYICIYKYMTRDYEILTDRRIGYNDHDVCVRSEDVDKRGKRRVSHLQTLKRGGHLAAAELELLDDVADLLEAVDVVVRLALAVRYHLHMRNKAKMYSPAQ